MLVPGPKMVTKLEIQGGLRSVRASQAVEKEQRTNPFREKTR